MTRLPIHARVHLGSDAKLTATELVRCPEDSRWTPVGACRRCPKCTSVESGAVTCTPEREARTSRLLERAPITEVMDDEVLCVDSDASVDSVRQAMAERRAPIAVVVDGSGHAIGVCSRLDLAQRSPRRRVETCMTPFVITMLDSTTVADALELVVDRDLQHVPVLAEGRVVGLVTPRAMIRWLAQNLRDVRKPRTAPPSGSRKTA